MSWFKKEAPAIAPDLAALRAREQELVARQRALESEFLDTSDIERGNEITAEINDLNARIGVLRGQIEDFPR